VARYGRREMLINILMRCAERLISRAGLDKSETCLYGRSVPKQIPPIAHFAVRSLVHGVKENHGVAMASPAGAKS
jgi:hypothetical protein